LRTTSRCATDVIVGVGAHLRCHGKGRKHRAVPLTDTVQLAVRAWLTERCGQPGEPVFVTRTGRRLSPDAVQRRISLHTENVAERCASLHGRRLSPHIFRHASAMNLQMSRVATDASFGRSRDCLARKGNGVSAGRGGGVTVLARDAR
jgi:site-specific recombinase XerC